MALSRRTMTPSAAIRLAPCDKVMLTMAGNSSGVSPTERASANSSESMAGRCISKCSPSTNTTITSMMRVSK